MNDLTEQPKDDFCDVDRSEEPERAIAYLDELGKNPQIIDLRRQMIDSLALCIGDRVLEVGAGTGHCARALAQQVGPSGCVIGVDRSGVMIQEAKRRTRPGLPVSFQIGEATRLGFPDATFDACLVERVLIHVADVEQALGELIRVAKCDVRIVACEGDTQSLVIDAQDHDATRIFKSCLAGVFHSPCIGSQLGRYFTQLGLQDVAVEACPITFTSYHAFRVAVGLDEVVAGAIEQGDLPPARWARWVACLEQADRTAHFFAAGTMFIVSGQKKNRP